MHTCIYNRYVPDNSLTKEASDKCICKYIHIFIYLYVYKYEYIYAYMYIQYIYIYLTTLSGRRYHEKKNLCIYKCIRKFAHLYTSICLYIYIHICIHVYTIHVYIYLTILSRRRPPTVL
jgi:hypothetical protein